MSLRSSKTRSYVEFAALLVLVYFVVYVAHTAVMLQKREHKRPDQLETKIQIITTPGKYNSEIHLIDDLTEAAKGDVIDAYVLTLGNEIVFDYPSRAEGEKLLKNVNHLNFKQEYADKVVFHTEIKIKDQAFQLRAVQWRDSLVGVVIANFSYQHQTILVLLLGITLAFTVVFKRSRQAIANIVNAIRGKRSNILGLSVSDSAEEKAIVHFIQAQMEKEQQLISVKSFAEKNMLSAKFWAMQRHQSGGTVETTFVRFDMNGYTGIWNDLKHDPAMQATFRLVWIEWGLEIIKRYGCYSEADVGDELLAFADNESGLNHKVMALQIARTVMEEVPYLEKALHNHLGRQVSVTFKIALDTGSSVHKVSDNGYHSLESSSKIDTARYLDQIKNKKHSSFIFHEREREIYSQFTDELQSVAISGKGTDNKDYGTGYIGRHIDGLNDLAPEMLAQIGLYRSVQDICFMLEWLGERGPKDELTAARVIHHLRSFPYNMTLVPIYSAYTRALAQTSVAQAWKIVTALVGLGIHIFENSDYAVSIAGMVDRYKNHDDNRLAAEATHASRSLMKLPVDPDAFLATESSRKAADALLVYVEEQGVTTGVILTLEKWYKSKRIFDTQRAMYVCYRILKSYKETKYEVYRANDEFPKLKEMLVRHKDSGDASLRRWADRFIDEVENGPRQEQFGSGRYTRGTS